MKIAFIVPFLYKWGNYSNVRSNYEYLQKLGYEVDLYNKSQKPSIDFSKYDLVMLHGSGSVLSEKQLISCKCPIISFGWSDPNLFNEVHYQQGIIYCTNDFIMGNRSCRSDRKIYFYNTACDVRHHKNLQLPKETDVLVYGIGKHRFVPERNEVVNKLRKEGFKIKVFGRDWDKHPDTFGFIEGLELAQEICKARVVLDITNKETAWAHRIFECSARATPVLTMDREDTKSFFLNNEIFLYENYDEIPVKLNWILKDEELQKYYGEMAEKACYEHHDISIRIKQLDKIIKESFNG